MASLFLSYSRDDVRRIRPLASALEGDGHTVWWDSYIAGGQRFADAIEEALESADAVVVCWTKNSVHSEWVRDEAGAGRDKGCLVPITLDGCPPPLGFRQYQTIDLSGWNGRSNSHALDPLKSAVRARIGACAERNQKRPAAGRPSASRRWTAGLAVVLGLSAGAALLYPRVAASSGPIEPKVAIGQFGLVSTDLPSALPQMLSREIVAAFGVENAVAVVSPGDRNASKAPFAMEGNISRHGPSLRFTISLRNQRTGVVLWSNAYEHEASDAVAARQAAVGASQVVRCGLWGASSYRKRMPDEALSLYFKWCNEHWTGSTSQAAELDAARRVTTALPDFSFGWSALALATVPLAVGQSAESAQLRQQGRDAARRSMEIDGRNPEGYMALAGLLPIERYSDREALLRRSLDARPTECGCERQAYGDFLVSVGRLGEAVEQYERARDMRPLAPFSNLRLAQALYMVDRDDEADRVLNSAVELWPDATSLRLLTIKSALWTKRYDEAVVALSHPDLPLTSRQRQVLGDAFQALKSQDAARRAKSIAQLNEFAADARYNDKLVVGLLAALGASSAALEASVKLVRARGILDTEVLFEPNMAAARGEHGYADLVRRLGLMRYWHSAPSPPDICRDQPQPAFCVSA